MRTDHLLYNILVLAFVLENEVMNEVREREISNMQYSREGEGDGSMACSEDVSIFLCLGHIVNSFFSSTRTQLQEAIKT